MARGRPEGPVLLLLWSLLAFPASSFHGKPGLFWSDQGKVVGIGRGAYFRPISFWENEDDIIDVKVPTEAELAAEGVSVEPNQTEFTIAYHIKNANAGARVFVMVPPAYDFTEESIKNIRVCMFSNAFPSTGFNLIGSDCSTVQSPGPACKMFNSNTRLYLYNPSFLDHTEPTDERNGVHVAFVKRKGSLTIEHYRNGEFRSSLEVPEGLMPYICWGGHMRFSDASGWIRDFRIYPRALSESEIFEISESCDGAKDILDDPSFGFDGSAKKSQTCLDYFSQLSNDFIRNCPAEAQDRCPVSCSKQPVCPQPKKFEYVDMGLRGPTTLCLNTENGFNINELVDRCKILSPFNDSWAKGAWPPVDGSRRLGHIPNAMCPGGKTELDTQRDFRVVHDPECDFDGTSLRSAMAGTSFSLWWWSKRDSKPGLFSFYHSMAGPLTADNPRMSVIYAFEFQDDTVWLKSPYDRGEAKIVVKHIEPAYKVDEVTQVGTARWVFRAFIQNGMNATYIVDGDHDTIEYRVDQQELEALWFSHPPAEDGPVGPTNFSALRFVSRALTIQQIQQIYKSESRLYLKCPPGQFHDSTKGFACSKCALNTFTDTEGLAECLNCRPGYEAAVVEARSCTPCEPGYFSVGGSACQKCDAGSAGNVWNASSCTVCEPGKHASEQGSLQCEDCPRGTYSPGIQEEKCTICSPGRFTAKEASTMCTTCDIGFYQPNDRSETCLSCNRTYVTTYKGAQDADECTCAEGTYLNRETDTCDTCKTLIGYSCPGGLDVPLVKNGFYALPVGNVNGSLGSSGSFSRMEVWRCAIEENCQGDRRMGYCPPHMKGYGCSLCEDGYVRTNDFLACESCTEEGGFAIFCAFVLCMFPAMYLICVFNRTNYNATVSTPEVLLGLGSILVTTLQLCVLLVESKVDWPLFFRAMSDDYAGFVMLDTSFAKPVCALGQTLYARMLTKLLAPFFLMGALVVDVYCFHMPLSKIFPKRTPEIKRHDIFNAMGLIMQGLYVMTCKTTFSFIECTKHPSAPSTLISYPSVECWSKPHMEGTPLFIGGILFHVAGVWSLILWLNIKAMFLFHDSAHRHYWRNVLGWLVGKWEPWSWYWGQVYMTRNFLLSLVAVFQPDDALFQCFLFVMFIAIPGFLTTLRKPWRHPFNNQADTFITPFLILLVMSGTAFVPPDSMERTRERAIVAMLACLSITAMIFLGFSVILAFNYATGRNPETWEVKRIEALSTALSFLAKFIVQMNEDHPEGLPLFISSIEPPERQRAEDFCMLVDDVLLKHAIKDRIQKAFAERERDAYIPHTPRRLTRANSDLLHKMFGRRASNRVSNLIGIGHVPSNGGVMRALSSLRRAVGAVRGSRKSRSSTSIDGQASQSSAAHVESEPAHVEAEPSESTRRASGVPDGTALLRENSHEFTEREDTLQSVPERESTEQSSIFSRGELFADKSSLEQSTRALEDQVLLLEGNKAELQRVEVQVPGERRSFTGIPSQQDARPPDASRRQRSLGKAENGLNSSLLAEHFQEATVPCITAPPAITLGVSSGHQTLGSKEVPVLQQDGEPADSPGHIYFQDKVKPDRAYKRAI